MSDSASTSTSSIAKPMATKMLAKRCFKLLKEARKLGKENVLIGVRDVQKGVRSGVRGIVLLAGDLKPLDVMYRLSGICQSLGVPYIYVPNKAEMKSVLGTKRSCLTVLIKFRAEYKELFDTLAQKLDHLTH